MNAEREIRHVRREDYHPMVVAFMPKCTGDELDCRASLLLIRDRCLSTKRRASEPAWLILDVVQKLADDNALQNMNLNDLKEIRRQAIRLVSCASGLDMIFAPPLPLPEGANAGG